jgi:hypothetical protein
MYWLHRFLPWSRAEGQFLINVLWSGLGLHQSLPWRSFSAPAPMVRAEVFPRYFQIFSISRWSGHLSCTRKSHACTRTNPVFYKVQFIWRKIPSLNCTAIINYHEYLTYIRTDFKYQRIDQDNLVQLLGPFLNDRIFFRQCTGDYLTSLAEAINVCMSSCFVPTSRSWTPPNLAFRGQFPI